MGIFTQSNLESCRPCQCLKVQLKISIPPAASLHPLRRWNWD
jgi:hypothetical protein